MVIQAALPIILELDTAVFGYTITDPVVVTLPVTVPFGFSLLSIVMAVKYTFADGLYPSGTDHENVVLADDHDCEPVYKSSVTKLPDRCTVEFAVLLAVYTVPMPRFVLAVEASVAPVPPCATGKAFPNCKFDAYKVPVFGWYDKSLLKYVVDVTVVVVLPVGVLTVLFASNTGRHVVAVVLACVVFVSVFVLVK